MPIFLYFCSIKLWIVDIVLYRTDLHHNLYAKPIVQINGSNPKCVEYYNTYQLISSLAKNDLKLAVEIQLI